MEINLWITVGKHKRNRENNLKYHLTFYLKHIPLVQTYWKIND